MLEVLSLAESSLEKKMLKCLIIDDDEIIRLFLKKLISKRFPMQVVQAANGLEGLEQLAKEDPDIIFLDVTMPLMDGVETLEAIRNDPKHRDIPVVVLTAISEKDIVARLLELKINDFLLKPLDYEGTSDRLRKILEANKGYFNRQKDSTVEEPSDKKKHLMMVDKDPNFRAFFQELYGEAYDLSFIESGTDCLKAFIDKRADIVIISEKVEIINPSLLAKKIKEVDPDNRTSLYLLSESGNSDILRENFEGVLPKAFNKEILTNEFDRVVKGEGNLKRQLHDTIGKQITEEFLSTIKQAFNVFGKVQADLLSSKEIVTLKADSALSVDFLEEKEKIRVTLFLAGSKNDLFQIVKLISGKLTMNQEVFDKTANQMMEYFGQRFKNIMQKRNFNLQIVSVNTSGMVDHLYAYHWSLILPLRVSSGQRCGIGVLLQL